MKIVNIDAPREIAEKVVNLRVPEFIIKVVQTLERDFYSHFSYHQITHGIYHSPQHNMTFPLSSIWKFEEDGYENIATLIHTIPIYLRDSRPEKPDENSIVDLLGAYYSNRRGNSNNPYIELFLTAIDSSVKGNDIHFKWLLTKVLIHELAHAALDIFNYEHSPQSEKVSYHIEFGRWREESMANATALRIIKDYGDKKFYNYAKKFMQSQDPEYALGVLMEDIENIESVFDSVFFSKIKGVDPSLKQEWLDYVNKYPDVDGLKKWNEYLTDKYVYVFKGKYYSSTKELVYDIVNKVLSDYENKEGEKMTYNTFSSLFHNIKMGSGMSYEPTQNVTGDDRYKNVINLDDGDFSLRDCWWDNEDLHKFIDFNKLNISIIEYKNY